jgi:hypothetical protein
MTLIQTARARVLVGLAFAAAGDILESTPELIAAHVKAGDVDPDADAVEFALSENARIVRHGLPEEQATADLPSEGTGEPAPAQQQIDLVEQATVKPAKRSRAAAPAATAEAEAPAAGDAQAAAEPAAEPAAESAASTEPAAAEAPAAADAQPAASA